MFSFKRWLNEQYGETHVFVPGKMRIPTIGHKGLVEKGKRIAANVRGKLTVGLSGAANPLSLSSKKKLAEKIFDHPVETGSHVNGIVPALQHFHKRGVKHLHIVAGSDRVAEYQNLVDRYNGKPDKKGNVPFHFDSVTIHKHGEDRQEGDVDKHPTQMTDEELHRTVSASRVEKLGKDGDYDGVHAYYRPVAGWTKKHTSELIKNIRAGQNDK